jgi:hypothetical protein
MAKKQLYITILFMLGAVEFFISTAFVFSVEADPKNAIFLGYSAARWGISIIAIGCGMVSLLFAYRIYKKGLPKQLETIPKSHFSLLRFISVTLLLLGLITLLTPPILLGKYSEYFERIQPLLIVLTTLPFQFLIPKILVIKRNLGMEVVKPFLLVFSLLFILFGFISLSKLGIEADSSFWNVVGVPLTTLQLIIILLITTLCFYIIKQISGFPKISPLIIDIGIALLIYIIGVWIWSHAPMVKHFNALRPLPPAYQYFPYGDARVHDLGAIFTQLGYGINAGGYTDKPLYMVFLAILHFLIGEDYNLLSLVHLSTMALILPSLFWFGKIFHSRHLGIAIALIILIRQRNAILLAHLVAGTNPRLFLTEMPTLLGIIILIIIVFLWLVKRTPSKLTWSFALLAGGTLGAISLIRLNPIGLLPIIIATSMLAFRKTDKKWLLQISVFILGFLVVFTPWVLTGRDVSGTPYLWVKILDVIAVRYPDTPLTEKDDKVYFRKRMENDFNSTTLIYNKSNSPQVDEVDDILVVVVNHSLHNMVTAFLALPDSLLPKNQELKTLIKRQYWDDKHNSLWNGKLDIVQFPFLVLNILFVAIGLSWSWIYRRWAGVLPALIFVTYIITLGFARNSGSRYIVPVDWIVFFYYILGIFILIEKFSTIFMYTSHDGRPSLERPSLSSVPIFTISIMLFLAGLVPIAQVPVVTQNFPSCNSKVIDPQYIQFNLSKGKVLYPYFENEIFSFTFLLCDKAIPISITDFNKPFQHGQTITIGFSDTNTTKPDLILLEENLRLIDIWHRKK